MCSVEKFFRKIFGKFRVIAIGHHKQLTRLTHEIQGKTLIFQKECNYFLILIVCIPLAGINGILITPRQ